jgi:hypothetical protein
MGGHVFFLVLGILFDIRHLKVPDMRTYKNEHYMLVNFPQHYSSIAN